MNTYRHKEAFALMRYACDCGHREVIWNSRDGVTPFIIPCPSCGGDARHVEWHADRCAPDHKPHFGQRVFYAMTRERAATIADERIAVARQRDPSVDFDQRRASLIEGLYRDGAAPDVRVEGYGQQAIELHPKHQLAFDLIAHLQRQRAFSERTFGPGRRTEGVCDHIRKELDEIAREPEALEEWVDVILLALDGAWRTGAEPEAIAAAMTAKQAKNEARRWPDWRTVPAGKAIEHDRSAEA